MPAHKLNPQDSERDKLIISELEEKLRTLIKLRRNSKRDMQAIYNQVIKKYVQKYKSYTGKDYVWEGHVYNQEQIREADDGFCI